jgi:Flp pilus assembly protein TadD
VLVVQQKYKDLPDEAVDIQIASDLSGELKKGAKVVTIVWSAADDLFRSYINDGTLVDPPEYPDNDQIRDVAKKLGVEYILIVQAMRQDKNVYPRGWFYKAGGKEIWSYQEKKGEGSPSFSVEIGGSVDMASVIDSIAKTWAIQINSGPLKDLKVDPRLRPIDPIDDTNAPLPEVTSSTGEEALKRADELIAQGRPDLAILILKDAIDQNPSEPTRRLKLAELLSKQGLHLLSASEARRAALLSPDNPEVWLSAARAEILAGRPEVAKNDVNEGLARGVTGAKAKRLLGDIHLMNGDLEKAETNYRESFKLEAAPETALGAAIVFALQGKTADAVGMIKAAEMVDEAKRSEGYAFAIQMIDRTADATGQALRDLIPMIRLGENREASEAQALDFSRQAAAFADILTLLSPPKVHLRSHVRRDLAQKLLAQSAAEVLAFARTGDPGMGGEATISLGEALYSLQAVRELHRLELEFGMIDPGQDAEEVEENVGDNSGVGVGVRNPGVDAL